MHRIPQQRTAWLWAIASSRCADLNHDLPKCKQLFLDKALASIPLNHCNDLTYKFLSLRSSFPLSLSPSGPGQIQLGDPGNAA